MTKRKLSCIVTVGELESVTPIIAFLNSLCSEVYVADNRRVYGYGLEPEHVASMCEMLETCSKVVFRG